MSEEFEKDMFQKKKEEFFNSKDKIISTTILDKNKIEADKTTKGGVVDFDDEQEAIEELKRIKKEDPPFWVLRGKDFSPELDVSKIPPGTARDTLNRYKELAKKREPEKKQRSD